MIPNIQVTLTEIQNGEIRRIHVTIRPLPRSLSVNESTAHSNGADFTFLTALLRCRLLGFYESRSMEVKDFTDVAIRCGEVESKDGYEKVRYTLKKRSPA